MRIFKLCLGILLLPACVGLTVSVWRVGLSLTTGGGLAGLSFWLGYGLWLLVFALLPRPIRTYVLGHELTHAIWALMMGARVSGLRIRKSGGQVRTSKTNWLITLAPYFFPFYAMVFMAGFLAVHALWGLDRQLWLLFFLVGLGWSFHVTFTLFVLLTVRQPDVQSQGVLFSAVTIYSMNLLVIALTAVALSPRVGLLELVRDIAGNSAAAYGWVLDKLAGLWHDAATIVREAQSHQAR